MTDPILSIGMHIYVASAPSWHAIESGTPAFQKNAAADAAPG